MLDLSAQKKILEIPCDQKQPQTETKTNEYGTKQATSSLWILT